MLPPIDSALLPPDVRAAGPEARELYSSALGFERMLVERMAARLASSSEGEEAEGGGSAMYRQMLPDALAQGVAAAGGIGLARALYDALPKEARS